MQYKPLWVINVRQKYAKYRFRYVESIATKFSTAAVDLQNNSAAAFIWVFEYTRACHRVIIGTMVWMKCAKKGGREIISLCLSYFEFNIYARLKFKA